MHTFIYPPQSGEGNVISYSGTDLQQADGLDAETYMTEVQGRAIQPQESLQRLC